MFIGYKYNTYFASDLFLEKDDKYVFKDRNSVCRESLNTFLSSLLFILVHQKS